jgi:acetolactate synthase I/II/III large subunit
MTIIASAIGKTLADGGIRHAFGVVGGGNIHAAAGLTRAGIRYMAVRHECGAISAADAYYRVTGEVAVCTTSHGAGFTNTATGLAESVKQRSGILMLCGDAPLRRPRPSDIDQEAFAEAIGARVVCIAHPSATLEATADALESARTERCPVVLCVPNGMGVLQLPDTASTVPETSRAPAGRHRLSGRDLSITLDVLARARRPLLLGGLGAWRSDAAKAIMDLGDRLGALLATTVMASNLFSSSPWSLGLFGGFSSPKAARYIRSADVVIAFGASLDAFTLHHGKLIDPAATVIQIDEAGPVDVDRVDIFVRADAATAASALLDSVIERCLPRSCWRDEVAPEIGRLDWVHEQYDDASTEDRIDPRTLVRALGELLPVERTVVLDGGHFIAWPSMYWPLPDPAGLAFMGAAFQAIGLGFAGGVGAAVGRPDRLAVIAIGDGGALMGLSELETLIRSRLPALVVIFDDASYGFEVHMYGRRGADLSTATFTDTDFAGIARSLGAVGVTVRSVADLSPVREWRVQGSQGTLVLDCKVARSVIAPFLSDITSEDGRNFDATDPERQ